MLELDQNGDHRRNGTSRSIHCGKAQIAHPTTSQKLPAPRSMLLLLAEVGKPNFGVMETRGHPIHNWGRTSATSSCGWITNTSAAPVPEDGEKRFSQSARCGRLGRLLHYHPIRRLPLGDRTKMSGVKPVTTQSANWSRWD